VKYKVLRILTSFVIVCFLTGTYSGSQTINFKLYGIGEGIIHPTIYTINQDKSGFLWLGTGAGVCRFDGLRFTIPSSTDTLSETYANTSYRDRSGKIWFGYDDGSVCNFSNHKLRRIYRNNESPSVVNAITETSDGNIIAVTQNSGFYLIGNETIKTITEGTKDKLFYSIASLPDGKFVAGTEDGLWIISVDTKELKVVFESQIKGISNTKIQCIIPSNEGIGYWIGTSDAGFYLLKTKNPVGKPTLVNFGEKYKLSEANVQWILEDQQKNLWVCTFGNGIVKIIYSSDKKTFEGTVNYTQEYGLSDNNIKNAFQDTEGNIWIGTYSNGLAGIIDEAFVFYNFKSEGFGNDILSVTADKEYFWLGSRKVIFRIDSKNSSNRNIYSEKNGIPSDAITTLFSAPDGILWIGTEKSGLYKMEINSGAIRKFFSSSNSLENKINAIKSRSGLLWIATNGGVFSFNLKTGVQNHYSTDTDLPHNKINDLFIDSKGVVWIATKSNGLIALNSDKRYKIEGTGELEFTSITEDKKGDLWATTYGDGLFEFRQDSLSAITEKDGLRSDYCYSILTDDDGNIWVGHRLSLSKINPSTHKVMTYGSEIGITGDCNTNAAAIDPNGNLRFGTTDGLIQYNYQKNRQKLFPPLLNLTSIKLSDKEIDFTDKLNLPYGIYRIRFDFVGLNYRAPASVKYQYKLEGWESEWSDIATNNYAYYPRIEDGKFTFLIKAYNAEGISSAEPMKFEITIRPPFWKRLWFIITAIAFVIAIFYLYIKYREQKQIQFQQYLQKMLDERTREVVEQKEEIETKNKDITDSINYAQRIQASILPSVKKLQDTFSGCFIFYQPRDIVSGDFYWFDKISDSKFVIVCGDSTGHGVPGALMSMIGTTLIKDICNRPDVVSPTHILEKLDEEIRSTLNQNLEESKSSDGMDLIACEIDTDLNKVAIASAMRPVILYQNGEQVYVQGSKSSIGGNEFAMEIKDFENQVYQLSKGDLIYMFSDGYPDQFGGPMGKKFKMVRLRNLLKDIYQLPMEEQYHHVKNTFNLWRDQYDQVDDVLFMGIRI
jgi:ligand-binding sensor domain-containing protein/serine phosphatase RsbU (regulator of sigma subunit)